MYEFSVVVSFCGCLSVCQCVITWQISDQAGGPETFFNFVWPNTGLEEAILHWSGKVQLTKS